LILQDWNFKINNKYNMILDMIFITYSKKKADKERALDEEAL
jgi:hypothetical protein